MEVKWAWRSGGHEEYSHIWYLEHHCKELCGLYVVLRVGTLLPSLRDYQVAP